MYRRSLGCLAKQSAGRTVVRDPRKPKAAGVLKTLESAPESPFVPEAPPPPPRGPLPFNPSLDGNRKPPTVGSMLASYAIAGMAVSLGVGIVRLIIG